MIEIEIDEEHAELLVEQMENELERIGNTLNSFRSNNLTHVEAYEKLQGEKTTMETAIMHLEEQIEEQTEDKESTDLGELFG